MSALDDVRAFHEAGGLPVDRDFRAADHRGDDLLRLLADLLTTMCARMEGVEGPRVLRARLMCEELAEVLSAVADDDPVAVADGLADLRYVVLGTAVEWGVPLDEVHAAVHAANMRKYPVCMVCHGLGTSPDIVVGDLSELAELLRAAETCDACDGRGRVVERDDTGKVQKPKGWTGPEGHIRRLLSATVYGS